MVSGVMKESSQSGQCCVCAGNVSLWLFPRQSASPDGTTTAPCFPCIAAMHAKDLRTPSALSPKVSSGPEGRTTTLNVALCVRNISMKAASYGAAGYSSCTVCFFGREFFSFSFSSLRKLCQADGQRTYHDACTQELDYIPVPAIACPTVRQKSTVYFLIVHKEVPENSIR